MPRDLYVFGDTTFTLTIPDKARLTFGPWSPPPKKGENPAYWHESGKSRGTLRIYLKGNP